MPLIEEALFSRLSTHAGLSDLIGTRAYPLRLPQNPTLPATTFRVVSSHGFSAMGEDIPDIEIRVQVDVWSDRYHDAARGIAQVAQQVRAALTRWMGTFAGVVVLDSYYENEIDFYEPDVDAPDRKALDFRVFYER